MRTDTWLLCPRPRPDPRVTLICLPYAGGGAAAFHGWADRLPASIQLAAVRLPGREARLAEPAFTSVEATARAVLEHVLPRVPGPFALFGHSLGGRVGYEAARLLTALGRPPRRLFVSASAAPGARLDPRALSGLPDDALRAEVAALGGTPAAILASDELWELVAPALRADFAAHEAYRWQPGRPLSCPLTVLGGADDAHVTAAHLAAWAALTTGPVTVERLPGDHFFAFAHPAPVLARVARDLLPAAAAAAA